MELLWVVVGIVLVWKFSSVMTALSMAGRVKAEVMCEEILMEAAEERSELITEFTTTMGDKEILSHDQILKKLKMKK